MVPAGPKSISTVHVKTLIRAMAASRAEASMMNTSTAISRDIIACETLGWVSIAAFEKSVEG